MTNDSRSNAAMTKLTHTHTHTTQQHTHTQYSYIMSYQKLKSQCTKLGIPVPSGPGSVLKMTKSISEFEKKTQPSVVLVHSGLRQPPVHNTRKFKLPFYFVYCHLRLMHLFSLPCSGY